MKDYSKENENYKRIKQGNMIMVFLGERGMKGDEFVTVKPWLTNVVNAVSSNYKPSKLDGKAPDVQLELELVHGYRCHDTRNNLSNTQDGTILLAVGIV